MAGNRKPLRRAVQLVQRVQQDRRRRYLVRAGRVPPSRLLRWHLDQLDVRVRKVKEGEKINDLYAFLETEPDAEVGNYPPETDAANPYDAARSRDLDDGTS